MAQSDRSHAEVAQQARLSGAEVSLSGSRYAAVGRHMLGEVDERTIRITTASAAASAARMPSCAAR